jgi:hypothetical protein
MNQARKGMQEQKLKRRVSWGQNAKFRINPNPKVLPINSYLQLRTQGQIKLYIPVDSLFPWLSMMFVTWPNPIFVKSYTIGDLHGPNNLIAQDLQNYFSRKRQKQKITQFLHSVSWAQHIKMMKTLKVCKQKRTISLQLDTLQ